MTFKHILHKTKKIFNSFCGTMSFLKIAAILEATPTDVLALPPFSNRSPND
jgi:hypothetical protein